MSFIRFPEGKKVFTKDGEHVGYIERVYISEFGVHTAVIKTIFSEFPQFEILMTQLRPEIKNIEGRQEEVYVLKSMPIKLQMLLEERKAEKAAAETPTGPEATKEKGEEEREPTILQIVTRKKEEEKKEETQTGQPSGQ